MAKMKVTSRSVLAWVVVLTTIAAVGGPAAARAVAEPVVLGIVDWVECGYDDGAGGHSLVFGGEGYSDQCSAGPASQPNQPYSLFFLTNLGLTGFFDAEVRLFGEQGLLLGTLPFVEPEPPGFLTGGATNPGVAGALWAEVFLRIPPGGFTGLNLPALARPASPDPSAVVSGFIEAERVQVVPEPSSLLLLAGGVAAVLVGRRRRSAS